MHGILEVDLEIVPDVFAALSTIAPPRMEPTRPEPVRPHLAADDEPYGEPRPSFANDAEDARKGFNLFGWMRPGQAPEDEAVTQADPAPRRAPGEEPVRDPSLDEELEIPAFLRRQMNPR